MLVNLKEVLSLAEENRCAIGAFNTPNLESLMAVIHTAEENDIPVIIMHAQVHDDIMPLDVIGPIMVDMAKKSFVPVCVHLDHGEDIDYLRRSLDLGFTSVMFDGSTLPYEDNVKYTCRAMWMARQYGASVEAEIGVMGGRETSGEQTDPKNMYTDPILAHRFVEDTGIDALACSFGTVHGFYKTKPKLDFERIQRICDLTGKPLVMHGGSGVSPEDFLRAIDCGIRKINYYSYMSLAGVKGELELLKKQDEVKYYHDLVLAAMSSMADDVNKAMQVFSRKTAGDAQ